jgi:ubiquinone/menaquinone biosynthesis C-methylase UbiE
MAQEQHRQVHGDHHHDWQSQDYVAHWTARDAARAAEREPFLDHLIAAIPFGRDAEIAVLDVGAGGGVVAQAVAQAFPASRMTLQDYSGPMLERARDRFADRAERMRYIVCDLRDPDWERTAGGPFDLAVSGIAIHNLYDMAAITACYAAVRRLLKPGCCFLDYDHFDRAGGLAAHGDAFRSVGFSKVETVWHVRPTAVIKATA